ncbi:MAG: ABC transporter ATP-binding protein [Candidatus Cloacimonetes bacterium]|nr:ABC transporter ATP-binding protein [Candidatus Cloacimonadota bacterium]MCF7813133.1 ABC transporter ATP-binding protein [Candidatus Cloacimonadota bacterium]MCF7867581.1 ABC transporter ATP-binding protein [Candidatus Cloacimonadota bacterium]MCF7883144.1 ABC transporter ATP-binding protein [Candidatus Cloacimonadota bacterium]
MLELKGIFKYYSNNFVKTYVLRDIDLKIEEGEFATVMGPSGAGKSTLLYILGMLETIDDGEYYYKENPVHKFNEKKRTDLHKHEIGFVFQQYHLIDELTVYENIEMPLLYQKIKGAERKSMVCDILDRFNIVGKKDLFPNQLSGGQQQLVGIARAIIGKPSLLLADEPTGNLNSAQGKEIMDLFKKLNENGTTIVQVTHSEEKAAYGNRIIDLLDGRIVIQ